MFRLYKDYMASYLFNLFALIWLPIGALLLCALPSVFVVQMPTRHVSVVMSLAVAMFVLLVYWYTSALITSRIYAYKLPQLRYGNLRHLVENTDCQLPIAT
ncbi:MAG: hypothetical protein LBK70_01620 [Clostridiales bacterium]|jgi:hypothetical protein|nr:hypothetical protein [Clostridiales bacterium]